jgi:hypothetical protein
MPDYTPPLGEKLKAVQRWLAVPTSRERLCYASGLLIGYRDHLQSLEDWQAWGEVACNVLHMLGSYDEDID